MMQQRKCGGAKDSSNPIIIPGHNPKADLTLSTMYVCPHSCVNHKVLLSEAKQEHPIIIIVRPTTIFLRNDVLKEGEDGEGRCRKKKDKELWKEVCTMYW